VVALLVTRDPGPWFEVTLDALAAQTYGELSVLVLVSGGDADPTDRVAARLPGAFVRRLDEDRGFGAAVNQALPMVEGAAFFLLCHDDCAPEPDAVHVMVEESYRSNAGVVTPKVVRWDDPAVLVHVGMSADKTGAVVERVQPREVDHGQHDAVRDVFVAPGGCTLIRADLLRTLGGFDEAVVAMGEDLDLSWRAQIAGARIVVAPEARVRHLELTAAGERPPSATVGGVTLQDLQRRHELRAVFKCYGPVRRAAVLLQAALLAVGEVIVAVAVRDGARARAVMGAWRYNLGHRAALKPLRRTLRTQRVLSDREVHRLMTPGVARLSTYFTRLVHQGFDVAHGLVPPRHDTGEEGEDDRFEEVALLTGSVGLAFSEDQDFDDLDDLGHRSGRDRHGRRRRRRFLGSHRTRLVAYVVAMIVLIVGARDLVGAGLPFVGQLVPTGSWTHAWHQLFTTWQAAGVGTTAPSSTAFGVTGTVGTVLFGAMGLTQKLMVLGCIPLGAWGMLRLLRPLVSARARMAGGLAYLGLPLCYNALARGRWDALVTYALLPFMLGRLVRVSGFAPFDTADADSHTAPGRRAVVRTVLLLGLLEAVAVCFAPAAAPMLIVGALGIAAGSVLVGEWRGAGRTLVVAAAGTVTAAALLAPWVVGTLLAGKQAWGVFGLPVSSGAEPGMAAIANFTVGPIGHSPLTWLLVAAAVLPLLIGRGHRLAWAARLSTMAALSWLLAVLVSQNRLGHFAPPVAVVLVPAAVGVAACVGLGVAAFESDLSGRHFGWRQVVGAAAVVAAALGVLPIVASAGNGRWGLPVEGYGQALNFLGAPTSVGSQRVLWLGDPSVLPTGAWSVERGFAYATSAQGLPVMADTFMPAGAGPASGLAGDVDEAVHGGTRHLGRLLAPGAVRYVVVVWSLAPTGGNLAPTYQAGPPPGLVTALRQQEDLELVPGGSGYAVFLNRSFVPQQAVRPQGPVTATGYPPTPPTPADVSGWAPLAPGAPVRPGTVYVSAAPSGGWQLTVGGGGATPTSSPAFGWARQFAVHSGATSSSVAFDGSPLIPLAVLLELALWLVVLGAVLGIRRGTFAAIRRRMALPPGPTDTDSGIQPAGSGGPSNGHAGAADNDDIDAPNRDTPDHETAGASAGVGERGAQ
jgi:GT2 family glycosyltransferase